jgi:hypothetical protein
MSLAPDIDMRLVIGFVKGPWTIRKAFGFAVVIGALEPVLNRFLFDRFSLRTVPFVFFPLLAIHIVFVYWQTGRDLFRTDWRAMFMTLTAGLLWAGGAAGSGWCYSAHVCMGGHMKHPPYAFWHYGADVGWTLALGLAAVLTLSVRSSLCLAFGVLASFVISYRFLFGSLGGMYTWLPL